MKRLPDASLCIPDDESSPVLEESDAISMGTHKVLAYSRRLPDGYTWVELRESFTILSEYKWRLCVYAKEFLDWHQANLFCGHCGSLMHFTSQISKKCTRCGIEVWPQFSVAIIVLIQRGNQALLVKSLNFKKDFYGLVSGFVEFGEDLEECLRREVMEETGLTIHNIKYFGSQSWPFPRTIMIGFTAEYLFGELILQKSELADGSWFTRNNLPNIPTMPSISRQLIDWWKNQCSSVL